MISGDKDGPLRAAKNTTEDPTEDRSPSERPPRTNDRPQGSHDQTHETGQGPGETHPLHKVEARLKDDVEDANRPLPPNFQPSVHSVIIGKGASISQHSGNQHLRLLAAHALQSYTDCSNRREKTEIVDELLATTKAASPVGAFVKQVGVNRWVEVSDKAAREKIGYTLRDLAHYRYRSSTQSKSASRRQKQLSSDDGNRVGRNVESRVESSRVLETNMKIPAETTPIRPLPTFPLAYPVPLISFPQSQLMLNGVMVPQQQLQSTAASPLTHNALTPGVAREINQTRRQANHEPRPLCPPPRLFEQSSFPVPEALLDPSNQHHGNQLHNAVADALVQSVFAFPAGFAALPPHVTVAEAILSQGKYTGLIQEQESGQATHRPVENDAAIEVVNRLALPAQEGKAMSPDDEWALAFGSSSEGSDTAYHHNNNNNNPG